HLREAELTWVEGDQQKTVMISGFGSPEEILEVNKKKLEKIRKAHPEAHFPFGFRSYDQLNEDGRRTFECPECHEKGQLTEPRSFNLMFETYIGALRDEDNKAYLRPETAQGIFVNFKNVLDSQRVKLPFGIAQIGKAFRNEINPRNYTFRSREFEQMEIE